MCHAWAAEDEEDEDEKNGLNEKEDDEDGREEPLFLECS
jgi:hypothetical protein